MVKSNYNVVWKPIENSSQALALDSRCDHTLHHGTRGSGKSICQCMKFRRYVGLGYGRYWRGVIFDREFKNLSDIVNQTKRFFPEFNDGCKFLEGGSDYKWVWPSGEELLFRHVKRNSDYENFHGHEYPFIGWNELTKWPTSKLYDDMLSTNRSSFTPEKDNSSLPPIPLIVYSTTNPFGVGHNWVKRRFINPAKSGEVVRRTYKIYSPKEKKEKETEITQVAIFGSYKENPYLDDKYIASLNQLTASNVNLRKAWLYGDWDVVSGGAFDDVWDSKVHILPTFKIPKDWYVDRAFDWGSSHPFSIGWFAESNGEDVVLEDGSKICLNRGSIVQIDEDYGCEEIGTNKGLKLSAFDICDRIIAREISMMDRGFVQKQPMPGPADNQISNSNEKDVHTIESKMKVKGVKWTKSDKSPGSRKTGLQLMRDLLYSSKTGEGPGLYIMRNCQSTIEILPHLARDEKDPDDVDTNSEDHIYDMIRYRVLKNKNRLTRNINLKFVS